MRTLGLDIGSNSVGSAWFDTERKEVSLGVSVFPAGVEETDEGRGAPKNQARRGKRSLRRSLARRSARKRALRRLLTEHGLLPLERDALKSLFAIDPWQLRLRGLSEKLEPHEFGRILLHLCQRRGALGLRLPETEGVQEPAEDSKAKKSRQQRTDEGKSADSDAKVKDAVERTKSKMEEYGARTFGELMARIAIERGKTVFDVNGNPKNGKSGTSIHYFEPIRNRLDSFEFHADRGLIRKEFEKLWQTQQSFNGELAKLLTDVLRLLLDNPNGDNKWQHQGALFGQRRTYWDTGTLGRCDLEPSDRCVPIADRHASYFRVLETVNNIRIQGPSDIESRPLTREEHAAVISKLRSQKSGSIPAIRQALKIDKRSLKKLDLSEEAYRLNLAGGEDRELNGDWFHSTIVLGAIGTEIWSGWDEARREGLNRAVLRFDPQIDNDAPRLYAVGKKLGLSDEVADQLVIAWRTRPKLEKRLKMSRCAVLNLLPYMEQPRADGRWLTQIEARIAFSNDLEKANPSGDPAVKHRARRYRLGCSRFTKSDRRYLKKHGILPPAPTLSNPVVRKAIHEVRRHVIAHIRAHGGEIPDRIVIEFAREATKPKKLSDQIYIRALNRNKIRKKIIEEVVKPAVGSTRFHVLSHNQLRAAVDRVVLCVQQQEHCAYSGKIITPRMAALGDDLEVDHIIPYSRCGDNSLNNRVLCFRSSNRNKARQTPREWWGEVFDDRSAPMRFMADHQPPKDDYFEKRDYQAKWRNFTRAEVPSDWKGSQLSDTAYAAREVQNYLQESLWPDEPALLEGAQRRIFVTKGIYTSILRRDWQLYQKLVRGHESSPEAMQLAAAKNRGDHREHAIDAVAIALTDGARIQELAHHAKRIEEERALAAAKGREPREIRRKPLQPPWGDVKSFRQQVLSQLFDAFDPVDASDHDRYDSPRIVVSHRSVGRKLTGAFHEDTLFGPVPDKPTLFTGKKKIADLTPQHLRMPRPETDACAIDRLSNRFLRRGLESDLRNARKRARAFVQSAAYHPAYVDPPPEKSGIVRDLELRRVLRKEINRRLQELKEPICERDADTFTKGDLARILKSGPLRMPSGVPIKSVVLLRTMNAPVKIKRRAFDFATGKWIHDPLPQSGRAYVGGNNQHIEIRVNVKGQWSGEVVPTYEAARRVRIENRDPVDRSDDQEKGGKFVMSLAEGETVRMRHKDTKEPGYFVVFKLDKPQTIQFKHHWDARRAKGEKDDEGQLIPDSKREEMVVSASQLKDLAPPGEKTPIKVSVDPLGNIHRLEPLPDRSDDLAEIDPRIVAIAREALELRARRSDSAPTKSRHCAPGSWKWMRLQFAKLGLEASGIQLSAALRLLNE